MTNVRNILWPVVCLTPFLSIECGRFATITNRYSVMFVGQLSK